MALPIASAIEIDWLIGKGAPVAIGVSGGKDSQAAALATFRHLDALSHRGARILVHADLGMVEWDASLGVCQELARHLGAELVVVRRKAGGLMERWEARWQSSLERYRTLSTVTLVPCWSTPSLRFCTSELKTQVILPELKRRFPGETIINVTGVRREESDARAKATIASQDVNGRIWHWRPIADWTERQVFEAIAAEGLAPHPAYTSFGMSRVSCRFCIMSKISDLKAAAAQAEASGLYQRMVDLEISSTFAFQGAHWLADIAPQLLDDGKRARLIQAKAAAVRRVAAEKRITQPMRFVKGWPTRMLTDVEADLLAGARQEICELIGIKPSFVDRGSIHARYAQLLAANRGEGQTCASGFALR